MSLFRISANLEEKSTKFPSSNGLLDLPEYNAMSQFSMPHKIEDITKRSHLFTNENLSIPDHPKEIIAKKGAQVSEKHSPAKELFYQRFNPDSANKNLEKNIKSEPSIPDKASIVSAFYDQQNNQYKNESVKYTVGIPQKKVFLDSIFSLVQTESNFEDDILPQSLKRDASSQSDIQKKIQKRQKTSHIKNEYLAPNNPPIFKVLHENAEMNLFKINNKSVNTKIFAKGTFQKVYVINADHQIIQETHNSKILLKVFHLNLLETKLQYYMKNSIDNYHRAIELGLPCAKIYNIKTALEDKYYLVEMVPNKIDLKNEDHLQQICRFFKVSYENKYTCDLTYDNLRVQNDGTVTLIDFAEKKINYDKNNSFRMYAITFLMGWGREVRATYNLYGNEGRNFTKKLLAKFTENLGYETEWIELALDEHFKIF